MSVLFPAILLALASVAFVLLPLVTGREAPMLREDEELTDAQHRKRIALLALRDVEYDFHAGKLDEVDYRSLKQQISSEALEAIDAEEAEWLALEAAHARASGGEFAEVHPGGIPSDLEEEIAELRSSIREGAVCPHCGHPNPRGSRFCGDCGSALPVMESDLRSGSAGVS